MLNLLLAISLNSPEQSLQLILLLLPQDGLLLGQLDEQLLLHVIDLLLLKSLANELDLLSINVVLNREVNFLLFTKLNNLLVPAVIVVELFSDVLPHIVSLVGLLNLELLNEVKGRPFIVCHILIPSISELVVLEPLCVLDVHELSLLSDLHVVMLPLLLISAPPVENAFKLISHHVVSHGFIPLAHLIHDLEEGHDPLIREEVDA